MFKCALQHFAGDFAQTEQFTVFWRRFSRCPQFQNLGQTTTPRTTSPTLCDKCMGSLTSLSNQYREGRGDGAYGFSFLSEKTRMSNRLQMSKQRQHILLSYFKTLSVGSVWVLNPDLPYCLLLPAIFDWQWYKKLPILHPSMTLRWIKILHSFRSITPRKCLVAWLP